MSRFVVSPWRKSPSFSGEICLIALHLIATVANGKCYRNSIAAPAILTKKERVENDRFQIEIVKSLKIRMAKQSILFLKDNSIGLRMGLKGQRGYFRIVKLEEEKV